MRKITEDAVRAFWNGENFRRDNTGVAADNGIVRMFLHANEIAQFARFVDGKEKFFISNAGWDTNTTKERLNGVLNGFDVHKYLGYLYREKGVWYHSIMGGEKRTPFPLNVWVEIDLETGEMK